MRNLLVVLAFMGILFSLALSGRIRVVEEPINGGIFGVTNSYRLVWIHLK